MEPCTKKMRLDLTADAGPVPFTLTSPQMRLAWAKTGLFQSLTPDILAMVLDKEKTMPGPRQHMRAVVGSTLSDINIELLDQNGERVDTQGEGFSLTLVVEYDMD
jgi:hypothetical protein